MATAVHQLGSCRFTHQQMGSLKANATYRLLLDTVRE
jgi:hypothetical protein